MAQDGKQGGERAQGKPAAGSVDREPSDEPTPKAQGLPVSHEDGPKGHPTSDRFKTEQAHPKDEKNVKDQ